MAFVLRSSSSQKGKFLSIIELSTSRWLVSSSLQGNLCIYYSGRNNSEGDICSNCYLAALFIRLEFLRVLKCAGVNVFRLIFKQEQTYVALC